MKHDGYELESFILSIYYRETPVFRTSVSPRQNALISTAMEKQAAVVIASIQLFQRKRVGREGFYVIDESRVERLFITAVYTVPLCQSAVSVFNVRMFDHYHRVAHVTTQARYDTSQAPSIHRFGPRWSAWVGMEESKLTDAYSRCVRRDDSWGHRVTVCRACV